MREKKLTKVEIIRALREKYQKEQNDICSLCGCVLSSNLPSLDHDHATGLVRGVLCRNCNQCEGRILKWVHRAKRKLTKLEWLRNLVQYWEHHEGTARELHPLHGAVRKRRPRLKSKAKQKSKVKVTPKSKSKKT